MKGRELVRQLELNDISKVGEYYINKYTKLDPMMIQAIIDKYIALKFEHLARGAIFREQYTGEVRLILKQYARYKYCGEHSKYDLVVISTGWRIQPELIEMIEEKAKLNPNYYDLLVIP